MTILFYVWSGVRENKRRSLVNEAYNPLSIVILNLLYRRINHSIQNHKTQTYEINHKFCSIINDFRYSLNNKSPSR